MHCDDDLETALKDADAINILRIQLERAAAGFIPTTREYARLFGINKKRLALCKPDVAVIHPGPMNRASKSVMMWLMMRSPGSRRKCATAWLCVWLWSI